LANVHANRLIRDKVHALTPEKTKREMENAKSYMETLVPLLKPEAGPYMFGSKTLTALDCHLLVMIYRLTDVGREFLVPEDLKSYAAKFYATPTWINLMEGRSSMYDGSGKK
jgi:hypothetical protein